MTQFETMKVCLIAAITVDGFIGRSVDHLADWTSPEDKKLFVQVTKESGTIVMGARTFATIGRALPGRRMIVYTSKPGSITAENVETTQELPNALVDRLKGEGMHGVAICGGASIYAQFMKAGVVDELYISIEPVVFGTGVKLFDDRLEQKLSLIEDKKLNDNTVLLHYRVNNASST